MERSEAITNVKSAIEDYLLDLLEFEIGKLDEVTPVALAAKNRSRIQKAETDMVSEDVKRLFFEVCDQIEELRQDISPDDLVVSTKNLILKFIMDNLSIEEAERFLNAGRADRNKLDGDLILNDYFHVTEHESSEERTLAIHALAFFSKNFGEKITIFEGAFKELANRLENLSRFQDVVAVTATSRLVKKFDQYFKRKGFEIDSAFPEHAWISKEDFIERLKKL